MFNNRTLVMVAAVATVAVIVVIVMLARHEAQSPHAIPQATQPKS